MEVLKGIRFDGGKVDLRIGGRERTEVRTGGMSKVGLQSYSKNFFFSVGSGRKGVLQTHQRVVKSHFRTENGPE